MAGNTIREMAASLSQQLERGGQDAVPDTVGSLLDGAISAGATDIHLECFRDRIQVKLRIDGMLHEVVSLDKAFQDTIIARLKILSRVASFKTREPQDEDGQERHGQESFEGSAHLISSRLLRLDSARLGQEIMVHIAQIVEVRVGP